MRTSARLLYRRRIRLLPGLSEHWRAAREGANGESSTPDDDVPLTTGPAQRADSGLEGASTVLLRALQIGIEILDVHLSEHLVSREIH